MFQTEKEKERQDANVMRLTKEKEELTRENANLSVQLHAVERDLRQVSEENATNKESKESLESSLYEVSLHHLHTSFSPLGYHITSHHLYLNAQIFLS